MIEVVKVEECESCNDTEDMFILIKAVELITQAIRDEVDFGNGQGACYVVVDGAKALLDAYDLAIKTGEIG